MQSVKHFGWVMGLALVSAFLVFTPMEAIRVVGLVFGIAAVYEFTVFCYEGIVG